ncbi:MAG: hypothetical protein EA384_04270 [Spirochaetaceae bacterium]|nr:MAG: hypothetical protein EA384_04270 [Spirochaetaceae bacterium]
MKKTLAVLATTLILVLLAGCSNPLGSDVSSAVQIAEPSASAPVEDSEELHQSEQPIEPEPDMPLLDEPDSSDAPYDGDDDQIAADDQAANDGQVGGSDQADDGIPDDSARNGAPQDRPTGRDRAVQRAPDHAAVHRL